MSLIEIKNSNTTFATVDSPNGSVKLNTKDKLVNDFITIKSKIDEWAGDIYILPHVDKGTLITMDLGNGSKEYRVLNCENGIAEVVSMTNDGNRAWDSSNPITIFSNGMPGAKYQNSMIDTYLNTTYYNSLSATAKSAIVPKNITQDMWYYGNGGDPDYSGYYGIAKPGTTDYTISNANGTAAVGDRYVYALSVQDVLDYVLDTNITDGQLQNYNIWKMLWNDEVSHGEYYPWLRSTEKDAGGAGGGASPWVVSGYNGSLFSNYAFNAYAVHPAFQIDLSKIEWSEVTE